MVTKIPPDILRATLGQLPKIDLHRHLEGSLRLATLCDIARAHSLGLPTDPETLRPLVQVTNDQPHFRTFLEKFNVLRQFYQSPEIIHRLTYEVIEDAARDQVHYLELRFTPMALAKTRGFALHEVTHWVLSAVAQARQAFPQLHVELIASVNRHEPLAIAEQVAQIAADHREDIVALDLAGDEVNFAATPFEGLFAEARSAGLGVTVHAGEWTGAATVQHAIERLGAQRIGHGVRALEDPNVVTLARERRTVFEVCLTSNVQTGVVENMAAHPLPRLLTQGLIATLNTDDPTVSNITLTDEYQAAVETLGLTLEAVRGLALAAARAAFLPPPQQAQLVARFQHALAA